MGRYIAVFLTEFDFFQVTKCQNQSTVNALCLYAIPFVPFMRDYSDNLLQNYTKILKYRMFFTLKH